MKILAPSLLGLAAVLQARQIQGQQTQETRGDEWLARNLGEINMGQDEDSDGTKHEKKQLTYKDIPIVGSEYIVHHYRNGETSITGNRQDHHSDINTNPTIDVRKALDAAFDDVAGVITATDSHIELAIAPGDILAYNVQLHGTCGSIDCIYYVLVNAHDASIISKYSNIRTIEAQPKTSANGDAQNNPNNLDASTNLSDEKKVTYNWQTKAVGTKDDKTLADIHTFAQVVIDFSELVMGFNPFNGNDDIVQSHGHVEYNLVNAYYNGYAYFYGDGDGMTSNALGVLDIVAHEMGHGFTDEFSALEYMNESGALSEGFSDIFSAVIEAWFDGDKTSFRITDNVWFLGEDTWLDGTALRYMMSPSIDGVSTDHYSEVYRGSSDNGGVHWNSGIFNHFFYLLTIGGQHHNPKFHTDNYVDGIGMGEAFEVVARANMHYFTRTANFASARVATMQACKDAFGDGSVCDSVKGAWSEVGVGCVNDDQCYFQYGTSSPCVRAQCLEDGSCSFEGRDESCNPCGEDETHVGIDIRTDSYPLDTYWEIIETIFNQTMYTHGRGADSYGVRKAYVHDYCLPKSSCYFIDIYDLYGDGFYSPGGYVIWVDGVQFASRSGGRFRKDTVTLPCDAIFETIDVEVDLWLDYYPQETSWKLTTDFMGKTVQVSEPSKSFVKENALEHHSETVSLYSRACYNLYIEDAHGDGMCCDYGEGNFTVKVDGEIVQSGATFGYSQQVRVGACSRECSDGEKRVKISINTDNFGSETHWNLMNSYGDVVLDSGGIYASNSQNVMEYCLPENDCYNFTITDDRGDGMCCYSGNGNYTVDWGKDLVASGGAFGRYDTTLLGNCTLPLNPKRSLSDHKASNRFKREEMNVGYQKSPTLRGNKLKDKVVQEKSLTRGYGQFY